MVTTLLIVHYLSFVVGAGGSFIAFLIARRIAASRPEEAAVLRTLPPRISDAAMVSLALLWLTGIALGLLKYGGFSGLGWAFSVKMVFVVALTLVGVAIRIEMRRARRGVAVAVANLARLGPWTLVTSWLAIVFAVIAFG
ncbi:hypothetical protein [Microbaculum marinisediminis]|uniref:Copper resistance protein D n=1 Tax=Microbaculum marinisediminis TaxID=2931392 RepID=A0AAW5R1U0_9HYPH|nr:hypothetical protein [Microbaculum sp. A6E488]MCT8972676.1 hypothetical protein [Microbaculum sp. A6E488]